MTSPAVLREYRRLRSAEPLIGAKSALLWARSIAEPNLPEGVEVADSSRGRGAETLLASGTTDGFEVEVYATPDYDSEPCGKYTDTWEEGAVRPHRWTFSGLDEYGQPRRDRDSWQWFVPEHGETQRSMAEGWSRSGVSRGRAWVLAGRALRDDARRAGDEREVYAVGARVSRAGVLLAEDRLYGCDVSGEYGKRDLDHAYLLDSGLEVLQEALGEAQDRLAALVTSASSAA